MSTDRARWAPLTWAKKRIIDGYLRHIQKSAAADADKIRALQLESNRTAEQVIKLDVWEKDVKQRGIIDQALFVYRVQLVDGNPNIMESGPTFPYDIRVVTDVPTLMGFMRDEIDRVFPDGTVRRLKPFRPMDALRIGTLETDGRGSALKNLTLLEKTVFPQLARTLKFDGPVAA